MTEEITIALHQQARFPLTALPPAVVGEIEGMLSWPNPEAQRCRRARVPFDGPERIEASWKDEKTLFVPSGALGAAVRVLDAHRIGWRVDDYTVDGPSVAFDYSGPWSTVQGAAFDDLAGKRYRMIKGRPLSGKMGVALKLAARYALPTLVVVKTLRRLAVWEESVSRWCSGAAVGVVGNGRHEPDADIVIATDRSMYRHMDGLRDRIGTVILDRAETHTRKCLQKGVGRILKRYCIGLVADLPREKSARGLLKAYIGPVGYEFPASASAAGNIRVVIRRTGWGSDRTGDEYTSIVSRLIEDPGRNEGVVADILAETADPKRRAVAVSDRLEHLHRLKDMLAPKFREGQVISGSTPDNERAKAIQRFKDGKAQVLLCTLAALDEMGEKCVDAVVVAGPFKGDIYAATLLGRMLRDGGRVVDYADNNETLERSLGRRVKMYREMGGRLNRDDRD